MAYTIIPRHGTQSEFSAINRVYAEGELLLEEQLDGTYKLKVGNGIQQYNLLPYLGGDAGGGNAFGSVAVSGQSSIVADSASDTLTASAGSGLTLTTNATTDTITISPLFGTTSGTICQGDDSRLGAAVTPTAHAATHRAGGGDAIKLDQLATPDDVTTLNATTSAHGLLRKLDGNPAHVLNGSGAWTVISSVASVTDYGAVGDNFTNNDAAFAAAIAANRGRLYFPAGVYRVSSTCWVNQWGVYFGDGPMTAIRTTSATNDVFSVTSPNVVIRDMSFDTTVSRTNGAYVSIWVPLVRLEAFSMHDACNGVHIHEDTSIALITIAEGHIRNTKPNGTCIVVDSGYDVSIRDIVTDNSPSAGVGISITECGDVTVEDCNIMHCGTAMSIWPRTGKMCASILANNTFFDNSSSYGLRVVSDNASVARCMFDQCWFSSSGINGVQMVGLNGGYIAGMDFSGCQIMLNGSDGLRIENSNVLDVSVTGCAFAQNAAAGISAGNSAHNFIFTGNRSGNCHGLSGNNIGIYVDSTCNQYVITGNHLLGNTSSNIIDAGFTKVVANNLT